MYTNLLSAFKTSHSPSVGLGQRSIVYVNVEFRLCEKATCQGKPGACLFGHMLVVSAVPALAHVRVLNLSDAITLKPNPSTLNDVVFGCKIIAPVKVSCLPNRIMERICCLVYNTMEKIICLGQKGRKQCLSPSNHFLGLNLHKPVHKVSSSMPFIDMIIASAVTL